MINNRRLSKSQALSATNSVPGRFALCELPKASGFGNENNWLKRSSHPPCRLATTSAEGLVLVQTNSQANTQHSLLFLIDDAAERSVFFPDLHSSFIPMTPVVERVRATSDSVRSGSRKAPFRASASRRPLQPLLIFLVISLRLLTGRPRQMSRR